ncbi:ATP-binding cassette sub-family C member Sur [Epargyreus clarus]|uniref:ATP-binding cassette sub-family C member Sur n=1 Tax=Epargyreus clarus TaxID=520877 RepID=UPI003C2BEE9A
MEAVCDRDDSMCEAHALAAALHSLHLYCASISAALICCCAAKRQNCYQNNWRAQNIRGVASIALGVTWCCGAAAATLRPYETVHLVASLMAPLAWLAAAALHVALWTRRSTAPILYLALYWLLSTASSAFILYKHMRLGASLMSIEKYIHALATLLALCVCGVDCICFYDEVSKRLQIRQKSTPAPDNITYRHNKTHFFSKISFFWLNSLLYRGYETGLEQDDLGELPEEERSNKYYQKFKRIYNKQEITGTKEKGPSMWQCFIRIIWPNFYIAGVMKLFGDLIGVIPPLGLAVIIQFMENPITSYDSNSPVTIEEFSKNGYVMLLIVTLALILQAFLSQNSTHLVTVEGTRLKTALQSMVYDKCMRLASWSPTETASDEEIPLLYPSEDETLTQPGLLTNLISQDTYNIMSCVWICHYVWAIPLKVTVILYLLYNKLGISAIIGTIASILIITPLQFFIGKKLSDNSKHIAKCTDHRISKISEILQGINVIKLYVWEDLFNEKILQLREVELKLLNKDSIYWGFLTFTTQVSTILVTVITFTLYYFLEDSKGLTTVNVLAGLALFNQLTIPLLILPVTVLMIIQAMVSTKRIKNFLELPESSNVREDNNDDYCPQTIPKMRVNNLKRNNMCADSSEGEMIRPVQNEAVNLDSEEQFSDDDTCNMEQELEYLVRFRNAAFSWKMKDNTWLDIDDLEIPAGKLIMIVGSTGSGKSSLLSAVLGEMHLERGDVSINGKCSIWYAGQPPWLLEGSIRENVVMESPWCPKRYAHVLRATGLRPDLQLLPEGDSTRLGSQGAPLSGGQRVRVCVARALYARARLLALDEPLGALDAALARHVVARALLPAARKGRTVLLATNRLELLHYADLVIVMEDGRVRGFGPPSGASSGALGEWARLAGEARAAAARGGAGPPGGTARERLQLVRALSRIKIQRGISDDATVGINEAAGAHLLAEVPTCAGGSWRKTGRTRTSLARQLSSPPPSMHNSKWRREVRRTVSVDASNVVLRRLLRPHTHRTLPRWTPKTLRRLISSESDTSATDNQNNDTTEDPTMDSTFTSLTSNGVETTTVSIPEKPAESKEDEPVLNECAIWWEYARACGWWGAAYWAAAAAAQALALAADAWLSRVAADNSRTPLTDEQMWSNVRSYAALCCGGLAAAGGAVAAGAAAGGRARRRLHERLLRAALRLPLHRHRAQPPGALVHRFSADVLVVDKKLPTAVSRWAQLALLCGAAMVVNAVVSPWSLLATVPAFVTYIVLQDIYLRNARELQREEATTAASALSLAAQTSAGAGTVRAGRLQPRLRAAFLRRLDRNHAALLLLNAANRWLGLTLDLVGAGSVCVSLALALHSCADTVAGSGAEAGAGSGAGAAAGLAGAYALLLPAYLAHLAKCRADLHLQLAAVERLLHDTRAPQEDYRDDCPVPAGWERNGKIEFQDVTIQPQPGSPPVLKNINFTVQSGEKVAVCGRSGSGKSTLLLSCVSATTIQSGRILIDGHDVTRVPLRALRHRIVVLPQETIMFSGTLRENLDPLAMHTDEEIWQSLRAVGLYDFVHAQPAGLECGVGRAGSGRGWSGGRAARAVAARAALHAARGAAALLLDEPAAALDAPAERALLAALAAAAPGLTLITVAHRIASLQRYDAAVVLEAGRVAERGPPRALLAAPAARLKRLLPDDADDAADTADTDDAVLRHNQD